MEGERREQGWNSKELQIPFEGVGEESPFLTNCGSEICGWAIQGSFHEEVASNAEGQSLQGHDHLETPWHWGQSINTAQGKQIREIDCAWISFSPWMKVGNFYTITEQTEAQVQPQLHSPYRELLLILPHSDC